MHPRLESPSVLFALAILTPGCIVNSVTQSISDSGFDDDDTGASATDDPTTDPTVGTTGEDPTGTTGQEPTGTTGEEPTGTTGEASSCGDGIVDGDEECDDGGESALCNDDCTLAACGDGLVNASAGEECDGLDLAGATCQSLGFTSGSLACDLACAFDPSGCSVEAPAAPLPPSLSFGPIKQFELDWAPVDGAAYYRLEQSLAFGEPFDPVSGDIVGESYALTVPLHLRANAGYRLLACNVAGCTPSLSTSVNGTLEEAVGYFKASNTGQYDAFGQSVALSADGNTLVVGAIGEDGGSIGIDGNEASNNAAQSGAVYVFVRDGMGQWSQQAYIKASNTGQDDWFGSSVALSADGNTLVVGTPYEDSNATGVDGDQTTDTAPDSGAVYVFVRDGIDPWSQQAYIKASNTGASDWFGSSVALSADGSTLVASAPGEDSSATGVDGDQANNGLSGSGAVYVLVRDGIGQWAQQAYVKASNTGGSDEFGLGVALDGSGDLLAVGAPGEDSNASGIDGDALNNSATNAGAVYLFARDGIGQWAQAAYVKASNPTSSDEFGHAVALSADGGTLAASAPSEDTTASASGAAYVFVSDGMGAWSEQAMLKAAVAGSNDQLGDALSMSADGSTLVVGAILEDGYVTGINNDRFDFNASSAGAAYVFVRDDASAWSQVAFVKGSNVTGGDEFGTSVALSEDASTLVVGAPREEGDATGVGGPQTDTNLDSGAVFMY